jgi:hypothetical protein
MFFIGLHVVAHARRFDRCMISVSRLRDRVRDFAAQEWILDSGAFGEVTQHGGYRAAPEVYAEQIARWSRCGQMVAAVGQDWMCEPMAVMRTGLSVREHQLLTVDRYHELRRLCPTAPLMPVLQGYEPSDYARHIVDYGHLLPYGAWVGVGSVCKRNGTPAVVEDVLLAIYRARPDLRLHGFGVKLTSLASGIVRALLYSADSMAWSWSARRQGRNANSADEAARYVSRVERQEWQSSLFAPERCVEATP